MVLPLKRSRHRTYRDYSAGASDGAFVSPDGDLKSLKGVPGGPGFLDGAAVDNSGIAIVGGASAKVPFTALLAPNGTLTFLNGPGSEGQIDSISQNRCLDAWAVLPHSLQAAIRNVGHLINAGCTVAFSL
jgi:hypothetical protein